MDTHLLQARLQLPFTPLLLDPLQVLLRWDRHHHHLMRHHLIHHLRAHPTKHLINLDTPRLMRRHPHFLREVQRFLFLARREAMVRPLLRHLDLLDSLVGMGPLLGPHHPSRRMVARLSSLSIINILHSLAHLTSLPTAGGLDLL